MKPLSVSFSMAAADADGVCLSQTPSGGGVQALTINGNLATGGVATFDVARRVSITSNGADSGRTFTVTGTDRYGNIISEIVTGPASTTVLSGKNFKTITGVSVDDDTAGAITVGSGDAAETKWYPVDRYLNPFNIGFSVERVNSPDFTYGIEVTYDDVFADGFQESDAKAYAHSTITTETTDQHGQQVEPITAFRFVITSYVAGGFNARAIYAGG